MPHDYLLSFGPYRLDPGNEQLWRDTQLIRLTPKAWQVLRCLVERPGQLVTKEELFRLAWPETVVSDAALTSCIQELRKALGDDPRSPLYLETVHRRGFRFIAPLTTAQPVQGSKFKVQSSKSELTPATRHPTPFLVGRETELAQLQAWLDKALRGERQLGFIRGEPGIGKTTLVDTFLTRLASRPEPGHEHEHEHDPWIAWGQCIEHYGAGEAYLPLLEALGRLCRDTEGQRVRAILAQYAPTWLVQLSSLLTSDEVEGLQRKTAGATKERMLRELTEAIERLTAERSLVLWLEDLQWCDVSTLDWLAYMARRREPARLLVIGTYRPVEVLVREHPLRVLKQELQVHGYCTELLLDFLSEEAIAEYLAIRFPTISSSLVGEGKSPRRDRQGAGRQTETEIETERRQDRPLAHARGSEEEAALRGLARLIHRRTDGNPLFMVTVVNELVARDVLVQSEGQWELKGRGEEVESGVPESLQQLIAQQIERARPETRRLLEVASVAGAEFSAAAVAAGVETEIHVIEQQCEELVRREHFLRASGTEDWPDGTVAARYGFRHALYQEVLYDRLTARRRQRLHQRIGERVEVAYGEQAREIAAELAVHFERGRDYRRAIQYLQQAGENASQRSASVEAISLLSKELELLNTLPDTPERIQQELTLQIALGALLMATKGIAAPEVRNAYARARELCQLTGETSQLFPILQGLCEFYGERGEYQTALELGEQLLALAQRQPDPAPLLFAHQVLGDHLFWLGEFATAREHLEQGIALYDAQQHRSLAFRYGYDPGVTCQFFAAIVLWFLGYPDQALKEIHAALSLARDLSHLYTSVCALHFASRLHQLRREAQATQERAETEIALSTEQGFALFLAGGAMYRGWALAEQGQGKEGIAQIHQGLTAYRATGAEMARPYFLALLAEAYGKVGEAEQGLAALVEALAQVEKTGERLYEAELYRLKGQLTLQQFQVPSSKFQVPYTLHPTPTPRRKPKRVFSRPLRSPAASRRSRWSCGR